MQRDAGRERVGGLAGESRCVDRGAVEIFREVLKVAAPAGVYQSILDVGPDVGPLLHAVYEDARHTAQTNELISYINRLLDGWRVLYQSGGNRQHDTERGSLSAREREVVDLKATAC